MQVQGFQPNQVSHLLSPILQPQQGQVASRKPFIEANTQQVKLRHLEQDCVIPVFSRDNERTLSHQEFIEATYQALDSAFGLHSVNAPEIRVSHTVKGRAPEAIHKSVKDLQEHEKTIYYERMAFAIEVKGFTNTIAGNPLTLTVGGVRAYNTENLFNKKVLEHFKFFIGFQNLVCCNMCVSSDGFVEDMRVSSMQELSAKITDTIRRYNAENHLSEMRKLTQQSVTEQQFAQIIGKCRLYQYLPKSEKLRIPSLSFNDTQVTAIAREYFQDENFSREAKGEIDLWRMYNLFTGANKSSYIDQFLSRGVNAFELVKGVSDALSNPQSAYSWFLK